MKQLNLLKSLFLLCALMVGSLNSAWAADETLTFSTLGLTNGTQYKSFVGSSYGINFNLSFGDGSNDGKYYDTGAAIRVYGGGHMTVTSAKTIAKIELTFATGESTNEITANGGTYESGTWTGSATSVTFTVGGSSGHRRIASVGVTYEAVDARTPVATIGDLGLTTLNFGAEGTFDPTITPATGLTASDYKVAWTEVDNDQLLLTDEGEYVAGNTKGNVDVKVTVTPVAAKEETYKAVSKTYTVKIVDPNAGDGSYGNPYSVEEAIENCPASGTSDNVYIKGIVSKFYDDDIVSDGKNYRYYISDDGTTAKQLLVYKGKKSETEDFSAASDLLLGDELLIYGGLTTYGGTKEVAAGNYIVNRVTKTDPELLVEDDFEMEVTTTKDAADLWAATSDGAVSFASSNEAVAKVVGDKLEAYTPGTATITVSIAATTTYAAGSASFVVTVTSKPALAPEGPAAGSTYSLVTDAATLNAGDKLLFVNEGVEKNYAMSTTQNTNNRGQVEVTVSESTISTVPVGAQVISLEGETGAWYFNVGDGYLYAASNGSNYLKTEVSKDDNAKATISIADDVATIVFQGTNTRNNLRYNATSNLFSCYASTSDMAKPSIYRQNVASTFDITIDSKGDGWRTIVTSASATLPTGLTAYTATADESDKVTLTEVASLKAGNAYILKGAVGSYTLTVTNSPVEPAGNELRVSTSADGNGAFVLAKKNGVVGFYKWNGGSLGAGRVILPASAVPDAAGREFIGLGDATAISNVTVESKADNRYYNLAGQVVAQPAKGLYIVNGKKVIMK